jgi:hypothetical protein
LKFEAAPIARAVFSIPVVWVSGRIEALMAKAKLGDIQKSYILIAEKDGIELARAKSPSKDQAGFITLLVTHRLDIFDAEIKCRAEDFLCRLGAP